MSDTPFEDDLRRRFAAAEVDVPIDVPAILTAGKRSRQRQRWWTAAGVVLTVAVAVVIALLVVHTVRQAIAPEPTGGVDPALTPSASPSSSLSASPSPSTQADLTRSQFDDLVQAQLRAKGFPAPDPDGSETDRLGSLGTCGVLDVPLVSFTRALPSQFDPSLVWVALLADGASATDLAARAQTCLEESGGWTDVATTTGEIAGVATWHLSANAVQTGDGFFTDLAVYHNVLVFGDYLEGWDAFVRDTFVPAVDAALAGTPVPSSNLPPLPRVTVNGDLAGVPGKGLDGPTLAAVQRFADDVADGNLSALVTHCWTQPADEMRARWTDLGRRQQVLAWLAQPPDLAVAGGRWGQAGPGNGVSFDLTSESAVGYACPYPIAFTTAQASLLLQRLLGRHLGTPVNPADAPGGWYPGVTCAEATCDAVIGRLAGHVPDAAFLRGALTPDQWTIVADLATAPPAFLDESVLGVSSTDAVAITDATDTERIVFGPTDYAWWTVVAVYRTGGATPSSSSSVEVPALPRIIVSSTTEYGKVVVSPAAGRAVQRFADDIADGILTAIVVNCWTQPGDEVRARWSDRATRSQALTWLSGPVSGAGDPLVFGNPQTAAHLTFYSDSVWAGYGCPAPPEFTPAQAALILQRLVARHQGTPLNAADTDAEYPLLSCSANGEQCATAWAGSVGSLGAATLKGGTTPAQWAILADLASAQSLTLQDGAAWGRLKPGPTERISVVSSSDGTEWAVFEDVLPDSGIHSLVAVGRN